MIDNLLLLFDIPAIGVQAVLNGIVVGALFALVAYGLALVWGVMKIINICQGELVILGGYVAVFAHELGYNPLLSVPIAAAFLALVGWVLFKVVISRVLDRDLFISILATFGISIFIQQLMNQLFGADVRIADSGLDTWFFLDDLVALPQIRILGFALSLLTGGLFFLFLKRSRIGQAIRATAQNARAARLMGIKTERVYAVTYTLNAALCGTAGALVAMIFTIHPYIGLPYTIRSFMIAIIAGLGNVAGVAWASAGLGIFEELSDFLLGAGARLALLFSLLVVILVWRNLRLKKQRLYLH